MTGVVRAAVVLGEAMTLIRVKWRVARWKKGNRQWAGGCRWQRQRQLLGFHVLRLGLASIRVWAVG